MGDEDLLDDVLVSNLQSGADDCSPLGAHVFEASESRWLVELAESHPDLHQAVLREADSGTRYVALPVVDVEGAADLPRRLMAIPGVVSVVPAIPASPSVRSITAGIDLMAGVALTAHSGTRDGVYGGRRPDAGFGYPEIGVKEDGWYLDYPESDRLADPALIAVLNMSLGTVPADYPFDPECDIVNLATKHAAGFMLVVMSAGNCGAPAGSENVSAWAQAPWVLTVGATEDEAGTQLADYSSRGTADDPNSGPDLVAYGASALNPARVGTSYAAPRVSGMAMIAAAALLQLDRAIDVARGGPNRGVRLVGSAWIDDFGDEMFYESHETVSAPALPIMAAILENVVACAGMVPRVDLRLSVEAAPKLLRNIIVETARPVPGCGLHEIGAGFVSRELLVQRLASSTGVDLLRWFGPPEPPAGLDDRLAEIPLFDPDELRLLAEVVIATGPHWRYDWKRRRFGMIPKHPSELEALDPEERRFGERVAWPPAFT